MTVEIVFETHSITEDNESGHATGWLPGRLSEEGRALARLLGERRRDDGLAAVFASDLGRAVETVALAFEGAEIPILLDWRLRECDYGDLNGASTAEMRRIRDRGADARYPNGESWGDAVERVAGFIDDLPSRWDGRRVLIVGHVATRYGLDHRINGLPVESLLNESFEWQEGWEYRLGV